MGLYCMVSWWSTSMDKLSIMRCFRSWVPRGKSNWWIKAESWTWNLICFIDTKFPSGDPCSRPRWCHPARLAPWSNTPSHRPYHKHRSCCLDRLCRHIPDIRDRSHQPSLELSLFFSMIQQNLALIGNGCWIILASLIIGTAHVVLQKLMVNLRSWKLCRCFPISRSPNLTLSFCTYQRDTTG